MWKSAQASRRCLCLSFIRLTHERFERGGRGRWCTRRDERISGVVTARYLAGSNLCAPVLAPASARRSFPRVYQLLTGCENSTAHTFTGAAPPRLNLPSISDLFPEALISCGGTHKNGRVNVRHCFDGLGKLQANIIFLRLEGAGGWKSPEGIAPSLKGRVYRCSALNVMKDVRCVARLPAAWFPGVQVRERSSPRTMSLQPGANDRALHLPHKAVSLIKVSPGR